MSAMSDILLTSVRYTSHLLLPRQRLACPHHPRQATERAAAGPNNPRQKALAANSGAAVCTSASASILKRQAPPDSHPTVLVEGKLATTESTAASWRVESSLCRCSLQSAGQHSSPMAASRTRRPAPLRRNQISAHTVRAISNPRKGFQKVARGKRGASATPGNPRQSVRSPSPPREERAGRGGRKSLDPLGL